MCLYNNPADRAHQPHFTGDRGLEELPLELVAGPEGRGPRLLADSRLRSPSEGRHLG